MADFKLLLREKKRKKKISVSTEMSSERVYIYDRNVNCEVRLDRHFGERFHLPKRPPEQQEVEVVVLGGWGGLGPLKLAGETFCLPK